VQRRRVTEFKALILGDIPHFRALKLTGKGFSAIGIGQRIGIGGAYDDPKIAVLTRYISAFIDLGVSRWCGLSRAASMTLFNPER
jgi:hypothetical protein